MTAWNRSEKLNDLAAAFAKAQGEMKAAVKDSTNPHYKSKYADIAADIEASREHLVKHGLSVLQPTKTVFQDGQIVLVVQTVLLHTTDQWVMSEYPIVVGSLNPQQLKSAVTYARRTSYEAILALATEDDDGNEATKAAPQVRRPMMPLQREEYRIPFGKTMTGKLLSEVPVEDLRAAKCALEDEAYENKSPLTGAKHEFVTKTKEYLKSLERQEPENA